MAWAASRGTPGGADPHFHKTFSESFYVLEGTVRLFNGETWIDAVKGRDATALSRRTGAEEPGHLLAAPRRTIAR